MPHGTCCRHTRGSVGSFPECKPDTSHPSACAPQVVEVSRGSTLYRINDPSDAFFVIVEGSVTLFDARDKDESTEGGSGPAAATRGRWM